MYDKSSLAARQWHNLGLELNEAKVLIAKARSGRVQTDKYNIAPMTDR